MATDRKLKKSIIFFAAAVLIYGYLLATGTFYDLDITHALYTPGNIPCIILTTIGIFPFSAAATFFMGAVCEKTVHSSKNKTIRIILCAVTVVVSLIFAYFGAEGMSSANGLGELFPVLKKNMPVILGGIAVLFCPLYIVGYKLSAKVTDDPLIVKRIVILVSVLAGAFILSELIKNGFNRPRFRLVTQGYDEIVFMPWHSPFHGASELKALYSIGSTEFSSFPSGHSLITFACIYIFPSLSWVIPALKGKEKLLSLIGLILSVSVQFTRIVLGAHYLSDVAAGSLIGAISFLVFAILEQRIDKKSAM